MQEMDDDHATRLKHDLQIVLGSSTWTMLYSAIIISQTVLLAWDRWDTPLWTQNFLHLYYGFAQVWFLIELVMLWLVREPSHALHFSQVVPLQHAPEGLPDQAGKVPVDKRESKLGSEDDGDSGEGKAETSAVRSSEDAVDVDRAVVLIKVILLASGLVGVLTKQRAWTHVQALRIIWPATKLLPISSRPASTIRLTASSMLLFFWNTRCSVGTMHVAMRLDPASSVSKSAMTQITGRPCNSFA